MLEMCGQDIEGCKLLIIIEISDYDVLDMGCNSVCHLPSNVSVFGFVQITEGLDTLLDVLTSQRGST